LPAVHARPPCVVPRLSCLAALRLPRPCPCSCSCVPCPPRPLRPPMSASARCAYPVPLCPYLSFVTAATRWQPPNVTAWLPGQPQCDAAVAGSATRTAPLIPQARQEPAAPGPEPLTDKKPHSCHIASVRERRNQGWPGTPGPHVGTGRGELLRRAERWPPVRNYG
jgi:hypothetical protein